MKLTKFQHACFTLEKPEGTLVVDPGTFAHDFIIPKRVDVIVITHDHPDHCDPSLVYRILGKHPKATIVAHESIVGQFTNYTTVPAQTAAPTVVAGFTLEFFGGTHAPIDESVSVPPNFGVLIDHRLYYPGDSFVTPGVPIRELALPVSAPWLKMSDALTLLRSARPEFAFPTHDGILSPDGKSIVDRLAGTVAGSQGTTYKRLDSASVTLS